MGPPLLREGLAWFECRVVSEHPAGDHVLVLGKGDRWQAVRSGRRAHVLSRNRRNGRRFYAVSRFS